ncbi:MAG: DUF898 family protein [Bacteroidota bacterium]
MENTQPSFRQFSFTGEGMELFKIYIVNWLLTILTLGMYYPWAKATLLKYNYHHTFFDGSPFQFHGTGLEIFKGFIKIFIYLILVFSMILGLQLYGNQRYMSIAIFLIYLVTFVLIPFAIHGSVRYRSSRSSWRGIHFGYRGQLNELVKLYLLGILLTIFTFGIYGAWFINDLRKYIISHGRFGNIKFDYTGEGTAYFWLNFKGFFLTLITFGIYGFWWAMDQFNFFVENVYAEQNGKTLPIRSSAKGSDYLVLMLVNILLTVFTIGLALPWVVVRTMRFFMQNIWVQGDFEADSLVQTEEAYKDATGDDFADFLDLNIV